MHLSIRHLTRYQYDRSVQLGAHLLYLRPRDSHMQQVRHFHCTCVPAADVQWMRDDLDNLSASLSFSEPTTSLELRSHCEVVTQHLSPFDSRVRDYAMRFPFQYEPLHRRNLSPYLADGEADAELRQWLESHFTSQPLETVGWVVSLSRCLRDSLIYLRRDTPGIQSALETSRQGAGSCRDFAWLFVVCARMHGLAARFVSGYLFDSGASGSSGDMHAWAEVFLPGAGWLGLDPTHGIYCEDAHVPVAHAAVAESINPIQGSFTSSRPASALLSFEVQVSRLA